jgi:predicted phage-related endonuclease
MSSHRIPEQGEFLGKWVPHLPQSPHIEQEDALSWREQVIKIDRERFRWHFMRLFGIGGSEIGEIVTASRGEPNQFNTPHEIALSKLMRLPPRPQDPILRRGVLMEPIIRRVFHEDFSVTPLPEAIETVQGYRDPEFPWMRGNLDDFVMFQKYGDERCVVDYKAPSVPHGDSVPLLYASQLHQYGYLYRRAMAHMAGSANVPPPRLLLVRFDYQHGLACPTEVPWSDEIVEEIRQAGSEFWDGILRGEVPEVRPYQQPEIALSQEEIATVARLEIKLMRAALLNKAAEQQRESLTRELNAILTDNGRRLVKKHKPPLTGLTMMVRVVPDDERLTRILSELPGAADSVMEAGRKLDAEAMAARLAELGEDLDRFRERKPSISRILEFFQAHGLDPAIRETVYYPLSRKKEAFARIAEARFSANEAIAAAMEDV